MVGPPHNGPAPTSPYRSPYDHRLAGAGGDCSATRELHSRTATVYGNALPQLDVSHTLWRSTGLLPKLSARQPEMSMEPM